MTLAICESELHALRSTPALWMTGAKWARPVSGFYKEATRRATAREGSLPELTKVEGKLMQLIEHAVGQTSTAVLDVESRP
jgi:hypothetical protein